MVMHMNVRSDDGYRTLTVDYNGLVFDLMPSGMVMSNGGGEEWNFSWAVLIPIARVIYYRYQLNPHRLFDLEEVVMKIPPMKFLFHGGKIRAEVRENGVYLSVEEGAPDDWVVLGIIPRSVLQDRGLGAPCKRVISFMNSLRRKRRVARQGREDMDSTGSDSLIALESAI